MLVWFVWGGLGVGVEWTVGDLEKLANSLFLTGF